jgi:hypothetical protein
MRRPSLLSLLPLLVLVPLLAAGDCTGPDDDDTVEADPEILDPEPAGAPVARVEGRLTCFGDNDPGEPIGSTLELTGWVRAWGDPEADELPPAARVEAWSATGTSLGFAFANPSPGQDGRVAVTVPVSDEGFVGYVAITEESYLPVHFWSSRPIADTDFGGWVFLVTAEEAVEIGDLVGLEVDPTSQKGHLIGAIHDCDAFGMPNGLIQINGVVNGGDDGTWYVEGWDPVDGHTFSTVNGRFVVPNLDPGPITIKAFGRLEEGGPLTLLSRVDAEIVAGVITEVAMEPRIAVER